MPRPRLETKAFAGQRIVVRTPRSVDEVLNRLRGIMGSTTAPDMPALAKAPVSEAEFTRQVEERYVGESGFMLFHVIDHSGWLLISCIKQRAVRWILGNPLLASQ